MAGRLAGKVAVVTGAGRGIGRAVALAYGREGAQVVCAARSEEQVRSVAEEICAEGGEALAVVADVTSHESVKSMYAAAEKAFGGLDLVLANAGGSIERKRIDEGDPKLWTATIDVNLTGAYYTMSEAVPYLKQRSAGKILAVGSGIGRRGTPGNSAYAVAKAGLWMLVRVLAQELAEFNISVNELIPGPVRTELTRDVERSGASTPFTTSGEWIKQPEDVVDLALFLATQPDIGPTAQSYSLMRRDG